MRIKIILLNILEKGLGNLLFINIGVIKTIFRNLTFYLNTLFTILIILFIMN